MKGRQNPLPLTLLPLSLNDLGQRGKGRAKPFLPTPAEAFGKQLCEVLGSGRDSSGNTQFPHLSPCYLQPSFLLLVSPTGQKQAVEGGICELPLLSPDEPATSIANPYSAGEGQIRSDLGALLVPGSAWGSSSESEAASFSALPWYLPRSDPKLHKVYIELG